MGLKCPSKIPVKIINVNYLCSRPGTFQFHGYLKINECIKDISIFFRKYQKHIGFKHMTPAREPKQWNWRPSGEHLGPSWEHLGSIWRACEAKWAQGGESDENHCVFHGWRPWATIWPQSGEGDMDEVP